MFRRAAALCFAIVVAAGVGTTARTTADQSRLNRAIEVSSRRLDEWLGPAGATAPSIDPQRAWWPSPASMDLESRVAFELARARFSRIHDASTLVDGLAWHLQSRIVEELFDYTYGQPGHHALETSLFGGHVRWGLPTLVLSRQARDMRAPLSTRHAAEAVATLEGVVGWPALAAALRRVASDPRPALDGGAVRALMESALAVPLTAFARSLDSTAPVNYAIDAVSTEEATCGDSPCRRTSLALRYEGSASFPRSVDILIESGGDQRSTVEWRPTGRQETLVVESGAPPLAITIDPDHRVQVDDNLLDQRWRAASASRRPIKSFASWIVWLQHAMLTYGALT